MKTLMIGDLHGRIEIVEKAAQLLPEYNVCFMGDYLDSYDRSIRDQMDTLTEVLRLTEEYPDKVTALKGNHELSYIEGQRCSGWNFATQLLVDDIDPVRFKRLKSYTHVGDFLVSHAGVSYSLLLEKNLTLEEYLSSGEFSDIGIARGGPRPTGGLYWCDWFNEFVPLRETPQIVGHTGYRPETVPKGVLKCSSSYNVDCFDHIDEVLVVEGKDAQIVMLDSLKVNH